MKRLSTISLIALFTTPALALTPEQIAQQQLVIQQQQEQALQNERNQQQVIEAERVRESQEKAEKSDKSALGAGTDTDECPRFNRVIVYGNKKFSDRRIAKITDSYICRCVNRANMENIQKELTDLYIDRKYTLARVYFDQRNSKLTKTDCDIIFIIEEGSVKSVKLQDIYNGEPYEPESKFAKFRQWTKAQVAVPGTVDKIFKIKDFEQGLDQINRLQSNNATIDLRPVAELDMAGYSDVVFLNNHDSHRTTFLGAGFDNSGNKSVGENNLNISLNQDNLLALQDNIYLKYTHDTDFAGHHHHSQSLYSAITIPYGYWTLGYNLSYSDYRTTVDGLYTSFQTHGDTLTQGLSLERVIYRSARYRTNLGAVLQTRSTENWVRDMRSITGSRRSSNVNIFWNNTIYHPMGTIIVKPSYQRGLDWLWARRDADDIFDTEPHLQYDMLKLYLYSNMKFNLGLPFNWILTADGQYSFQNLYGNDQFSIGGEWTVRGYRDNVISGDRGFYVRNELRTELDRLMPSTLTDMAFMNAGGKWSANSALGRTQLGIFGDYGYVKNAHRITPDPYDSNSGAMAGIGAGLYYYGRYLNWSLAYSHGLTSPKYLQTRDGMDKEEHSIYWRIGANY